MYFLGDFNGLVDVFAPKPEMHNFDRDFRQGDILGAGYGIKTGDGHFKHNVYIGDPAEKGYTRLIDHIFVPNNLGEGNYNPVIGIQTRMEDNQTQYPSDHFPVSVTVDYTKMDYCIENPSKPILVEALKYEGGFASFEWKIDQKDSECKVIKYLIYNYKGAHHDNLISMLNQNQYSFTEKVSGSQKYKYYDLHTFLIAEF